MKHALTKILGASLVATSILAGATAQAGDNNIGAAVFNDKGELLKPEGYRKWVFIGAPITPHGLNNNKANFPEFHHVYVNKDAFDIYERTGKFPEGTVITKELALTKKGKHKDGSHDAPSGRGYFASKFNGMDVMVKDSKRFKKDSGWGFFNFGHHAPPYKKTAKAAPSSSCGGCHTANAKKDMVFTQFYPILNK